MIGVLLVNLGTPDAPEVKSVRRYLAEFLTDGRVVDKPWLLRQLLVRGLIIPLRARKSTHAYESVWLPEGSPLMVHTLNQKKGLQDLLGEGFQVEIGMRYGNPSIEKGLDKLKGVSQLIVIPLFPQQASATNGSVVEKVMELLKKQLIHPPLTILPYFHNHPDYIAAQSAQIAKYHPERYDALLFSYHGLPQRHIKRGDCYERHCNETTFFLSSVLKHPKIFTSYQSRLGREAWLRPYTSETVVELARSGVKKLLVACPAFVSDCLETIEEIGIEEKASFLKAGGETFDLVPCLNAEPVWLEALAGIVRERAVQHSGSPREALGGCRS